MITGVEDHVLELTCQQHCPQHCRAVNNITTDILSTVCPNDVLS